MAFLVSLRQVDPDTRAARIGWRLFEVQTCRNTRGNITGYGIFERYPAPVRVGRWAHPRHGTWHIHPSQATFAECRAWLDAFARGEHPADVSMFDSDSTAHRTEIVPAPKGGAA